MLTSMSGTRNGLPWPPVGEAADIPTGEALHLVASGVAEQVIDKPAPRPERKRRPAASAGDKE
jgi:hypothetical protein